MKKLAFILFTLLLSSSIYAQNLQAHYDLGKDRKYLTTTVEYFHPDKTGNTYFFIDMDYGSGDNEGVSLAYWEIARAFLLGHSPIALHIEYNGGFGQYKTNSDYAAYQINDAWLGGLEYEWNSANFSKGITFQGMYKYIRGKNEISFQTTVVWYLNFLHNKLRFDGFADFWREDNMANSVDQTKFIFLSEPQIWYNITNQLAVGSEIEISSNMYTKGWRVNPTIAAKWTF